MTQLEPNLFQIIYFVGLFFSILAKFSSLSYSAWNLIVPQSFSGWGFFWFCVCGIGTNCIRLPHETKYLAHSLKEIGIALRYLMQQTMWATWNSFLEWKGQNFLVLVVFKPLVSFKETYPYSLAIAPKSTFVFLK